MPHGSVIPRYLLLADLDPAETSKMSEAARTLSEVGPGELSWRDYATLAAYVASSRLDPVECHRLLAHSLAASPLASQDAGEPTPKPESGWKWPFKVFVLGRFHLLKGDGPIHFSRRRQRKPLELLQALIAFGGTEVDASKLTDALWPDSEGDAGYHALESALYRLRQLLGTPSAIAMAAGKLTLDRRQVWVDMWAFETELRAGDVAGSSPAERLGRLRQLYSGHFLEQEAEKTWAVEKRQVLREKFVRAIGEFARNYEQRGRWQEAADVYQGGIEVDSLAEEFHRGLIMCHRELGDHAAAVKAYRRCSELLIKRLGVRPSSKTLALYHSVRHEAMPQAI